MSIVTLVIGESGTGKTASLRNMEPSRTLLIQAIRKPLSFQAKGWGYLSGTNKSGNIIVSDNAQFIINAMQKTQREVIVLDDFVYTMSNEFMRRSDEKGYDKFTQMARSAWDILRAASELPDHVRVYIMTHTQTDDAGVTRVKTIGKLLDEKINIEGMVSLVLRTMIRDGDYWFSAKNSGSDTVKAPMGLFADHFIPNDLAAVDSAIVQYYGITQPQQQTKEAA